MQEKENKDKKDEAPSLEAGLRVGEGVLPFMRSG